MSKTRALIANTAKKTKNAESFFGLDRPIAY